MCKSFDYNSHSITIGATRTGKSIFLKYLQENLPINKGFTVRDEDIKTEDSFFNLISKALQNSVRLKEKVSIFIDTDHLKKILLDDNIFNHLHILIKKPPQRNNVGLVFHIAVSLNNAVDTVNENQHLKLLQPLCHAINNRFYLYTTHSYTSPNLKVCRDFPIDQFTKITFDEVLKNYLETMQKTTGSNKSNHD